jgi:hypothetical protein
MNRRDFGRRDVHRGDRVVFLQRHPGNLAVGRDGDVLGLQVLRHGRARAIDAHAGGAQRVGLTVEGAEIGCCDGRRDTGAAAVDGDDTDRALGVYRIGCAVTVGLTFVGRQHLFAVGGENKHVRQGADGHHRKAGQGAGVIERHLARAGLGVSFHRQRHQSVVGGHTVDGAADVAHGDGAQPGRGLGFAQVQHVHGAQGAVDDKQATAKFIIGTDFGGRQGSGLVAAQFLERQRHRGRLLRQRVIAAAAGGKRTQGKNQAGHQGRKKGRERTVQGFHR